MMILILNVFLAQAAQAPVCLPLVQQHHHLQQRVPGLDGPRQRARHLPQRRGRALQHEPDGNRAGQRDLRPDQETGFADFAAGAVEQHDPLRQPHRPPEPHIGVPGRRRRFVRCAGR